SMPFAHRGAGRQALQSGAHICQLPPGALRHPPLFGRADSDRSGAHGGMPQSHTSPASMTLLLHTAPPGGVLGTRKGPGSATAPGPGTLNDASSNPPSAAMQNTETSVVLAGVPVVRGPAAAPLSLIVRQAPLPKQPAVAWRGQKRPPGSVALAVPVMSGERSMVCAPSVRAVTALTAPWRADAVEGSTRGVARTWVRDGADAARRAVARVARRAGGGAGHPGARAAVAGPHPGAARRAGRGASRARLGQVAGEVEVPDQRNGRRRRAGGEVERAARRRFPGVQH